MNEMGRSQPPQGPVTPDDLSGYQSQSMFGRMANMLKSGWHHSALFKQSVRVGSGTALAVIDGSDGQIGADGAAAAIFFSDRTAPRTAYAGWYRNGTHVRLNTSDSGDIWDIDPTTGIFNLSAWTVISAFTNSWVDATATSGMQTVRYRKDLFGNVQLLGSVKTGTLGTAAFTLPVGFRPVSQTYVAGLDVQNNVLSRCDFSTAGVFTPQGGGAAPVITFSISYPTV
jgi:hypothetical protein